MKADGNRRERGAYYTPVHLAEFLADWAVRHSAERILDPSAGSGRLVAAATQRVRALGLGDNPNVWAVELHQQTFRLLTERCDALGIPSGQLREGDFFDASKGLGRFDVVLTNPPYVRHHDLSVEATKRMRAALGDDGAVLDGRSSSWAYFVLRSIQLLTRGGRLAGIVPSELVSTNYGQRIVKEVDARFERTILVRCKGSLFSGLNVTALLVLGEGYRGPRDGEGQIYGCSLDFDGAAPILDSPQSMARISDASRSSAVLFSGARTTDVDLVDGAAKGDGFSRLGDLGALGIGYVTGDSEFFHFTEPERSDAALAKTHVRRAVRRSNQIPGCVFRTEDWQTIRDDGGPCWILRPADEEDESVKCLIARGVKDGVASRMKCRTREPWWEVPLGRVPQALFLYMGDRPRIVENVAAVYATNSFFVLTEAVAVSDLAIASMTSVFQLSALVSARSLGGGLRKLQVCDALDLPIASVEVPTDVCGQVDGLVRLGKWDDAVRLADETVLRSGLGWSDLEIGDWQSRLRRLSATG